MQSMGFTALRTSTTINGRSLKPYPRNTARGVAHPATPTASEARGRRSIATAARGRKKDGPSSVEADSPKAAAGGEPAAAAVGDEATAERQDRYAAAGAEGSDKEGPGQGPSSAGAGEAAKDPEQAQAALGQYMAESLKQRANLVDTPEEVGDTYPPIHAQAAPLLEQAKEAVEGKADSQHHGQHEHEESQGQE